MSSSPGNFGGGGGFGGRIVQGGRLYFFAALLCTIGGAQAQDPGQVGGVVETVMAPAVAYGKLWGRSFQGPDYSSYSRDDIVHALTNRMCAQNAIAGASSAVGAQFAVLSTAGLSAPAAVAGQVSASLVASISLQISLVAAVATARGFDENDPRFDQMVFYAIAGDVLTEGIKSSSGVVATKGFERFIFSGIGTQTAAINKVLFPIVGQKFITIAGKTGFINLASWIPFVGPAISFVADGCMCNLMARSLDFKIFEGAFREAHQLRIWLENDAKLSDAAVQAITKDEWDWSSICNMTPSYIHDLEIKKPQALKLSEAIKTLTHCP